MLARTEPMTQMTFDFMPREYNRLADCDLHSYDHYIVATSGGKDSDQRQEALRSKEEEEKDVEQREWEQTIRDAKNFNESFKLPVKWSVGQKDVLSGLKSNRNRMLAPSVKLFLAVPQYCAIAAYWAILSCRTDGKKWIKVMKYKNKTIGYLRVSSVDQDLEKNKADIIILANDKDLGKVHFVEEKVSGKVPWKKRKVAEVLESMRKGDNIIVSELSRLGRSMLECMEILSIATEKGVNIYAVKGNWKLDGTLQSKIIAMAFSIAAEIEHDLISQRTKEALKAKKKAGIKLGRPKGPGKSKLDPHRKEIENLLTNGATQKFISKKFGVTEATMTNWMQKNGVKRASV